MRSDGSSEFRGESGVGVTEMNGGMLCQILEMRILILIPNSTSIICVKIISKFVMVFQLLQCL
jgi:hypothetical protein